MAYDPNAKIAADGVWRPEPHPFRPKSWVLFRHTESGTGKNRRIAREPYIEDRRTRMPRCFRTEATAQRHADRLNPKKKGSRA